MSKAFKTITLSEVTKLIAAIGHHTTVLVQGEMGIGKTEILKELSRMFPDYFACYADMTTKDVGDLLMPKIRPLNDVDTCSFVPNEEFGFHVPRKKLIMLDELGKAKGGVLNACLRLMNERSLGTNELPEGSIVFATTNLTIEGLGDTIPPHAKNRITVVQVAKPTAEEWTNNYALGAEVDPVIIATVNEYPQMFASFTDYEKPEQNPYIFDNRVSRAAFVTPRSMKRASDIYKSAAKVGGAVLTHALIGTVGEAAAHEIMTMHNMSAKMPRWEEIITDPESAPLPDTAAGQCMTVMKAAQRIEKTNLEAWMTYVKRLPLETQALFARSVMHKNSPKREMVATTSYFVGWVVSNHWVFAE